LTYPYIDNIKEIIRPETVVVFDADQTAFTSAASSEKREIRVTSDIHNFDMNFKTRTDFYGRKKKELGGYLYDQNIMREVQGLPLYKKEDFTIEDVQIPSEESHCYHAIKQKIKPLLENLGLTKYICLLGGDHNFRLDAPLPQQYKSNREGMLRPVLLEKAREYIVKHHNAKIIDSFEADDICRAYAEIGYQHYLKHGWFNYLIVSFDKDQRGFAGLIIDPLTRDGKLVHTKPMLIDDGIGEIWLEKQSCKGYGFKWICIQCVTGDITDGVLPYQPFGLTFGASSAYKLLGTCTTKSECLEKVAQQYVDWFPDGVEFVDFKGQQQKFSAGQWLEIIFSLVYMKKSRDDKTTFFSFMKEYNAKLPIKKEKQNETL
jgi:hypothetical protein